MNVPRNVTEIWHTLEKEGFPTYLVGGAVRDFLIGVEPHDFDLATAATPDQIKDVISRNFSETPCNFVGESFGVVIFDGIEIATFRGDTYGDSGNDKDVVIEFLDTIEADLHRRDFTINAMAISISGELIDPWGGYEDIESHTLRFVGDANARIKEDANRLIRLCRFAAKTGFVISRDTVTAVQENLHLVNSIAPDRIGKEIKKAMECENASAFWGSLHFTGILDIIFPELAASFCHDGGQFHLETVWDHQMVAGDSVSTRFPIVKLATYIHDVGKPRAFSLAADGSFIGHEKIGSDIIKERFKFFKFSNNEIAQLSGLCRFHMRQLLDLSPKARRKLKKDLSDNNLSWSDLARIRVADTKANLNNERFSFTKIKNVVKSCTDVEDIPLSVHSLPVSGSDLIFEWQLERGPVVSRLQKFLFQWVIDEGNFDPDCILLKSKEFFDSEH